MHYRQLRPAALYFTLFAIALFTLGAWQHTQSTAIYYFFSSAWCFYLAFALRKYGTRGILPAGIAALFQFGSLGISILVSHSLGIDLLLCTAIGFFAGIALSFSGLPVFLRRLLLRKKDNEERIGKYHPAVEPFLPMFLVGDSSAYAYCRLSPGEKLRRLLLTILSLDCGVLLVGNGLGLWAIPFFAFSAFQFCDGILRGILFTLPFWGVGALYQLGFSLVWQNLARPLPLCILIVALVALSVFLLYFAIRGLIRRLLPSAVLFERDSWIGGIAAVSEEPQRAFTLPNRPYTTLFRICVKFEPFPGCEEYYFRKRWQDLQIFCMGKRFFPAGLRAEKDDPEVNYYIYAESPKAEKAICKFAKATQHTECGVTKREDPNHTVFFALLPTVEEMVTSHHTMLFSCVQPDVHHPVAIGFHLFFSEERAALAFLESEALRFDDAECTPPPLPYILRGYPFCVSLFRKMEIEPNRILGIIKELIAHSESMGGEYFFWDVAGEEIPEEAQKISLSYKAPPAAQEADEASEVKMPSETAAQAQKTTEMQEIPAAEKNETPLSKEENNADTSEKGSNDET